MTGMKEGAGEDPFAEEDEKESFDRPASNDDQSRDVQTTQGGSRSRHQQEMEIPYKFRRDGVQDGRDRVPLFLQEETKRAEREALRELEERFDGNVSLTDLREALVKTGLNHLTEVERELEAWGYGMTFQD